MPPVGRAISQLQRILFRHGEGLHRLAGEFGIFPDLLAATAAANAVRYGQGEGLRNTITPTKSIVLTQPAVTFILILTVGQLRSAPPNSLLPILVHRYV